MTSGYQAILDACVLVNEALRDTLLRLAEPPHLYRPRWSREIIQEMVRTLEIKRGLTSEQTHYLVSELESHFQDAYVEGYESLVGAMTNDSKDRHVLAAAVRTNAQPIVTFNLKHFPDEAIAPWNVIAQSPDDFLVDQYHLDAGIVVQKLHEQAAKRGGLERLLQIHTKTVPRFVDLVRGRVPSEI